MYVCVPSVYSAYRSQERAPEPLGLTLQSIVSCHVVDGNWGLSLGPSQ